MINITLNDGIIKQYPYNITPIEIIKDINLFPLEEILLVTVNNNHQINLSDNLINDTELIFHTWKNSFLLKKIFWTITAHLLAKSILEIYPDIKLANYSINEFGCYYDIDFQNNIFSEKYFSLLEKKIYRNISNIRDIKIKTFTKKEVFFLFKNNFYKQEIIKNIKNNNILISYYNNYFDIFLSKKYYLNINLIKYIKILSISGVYWKSNKNNKQITRIKYISFPLKNDYKLFIYNIKKQKNNDHRIIGKSLKLFLFSENVGHGLPLWLPNGVILRNILKTFLNSLQKKQGYEMVMTPHIGNKKLYITSGHWDKYQEDSFYPIHTCNENEEFLLKPMNCPFHCEIYKMQQWSYKDLPKRFSEFGTVYRYEKSGVLQGLTRTRSFTQDDAHIFCTPDQLLTEFKSVIELVLYVFNKVGFNDFEAQISLRDINNKKKYIGIESDWQNAENSIIQAVKETKLKSKIIMGEAAFYGPKLDFMIKDILGRKWQLGTIQIDYNLPERFNLVYRDDKNILHRPIMIHRAPFGSLERFIAILLEHNYGNLPLWLSPNQVIILTISNKYQIYARNVLNLLLKSKIRVIIDDRNEKIGKKIRDAELMKIPLIIIIGKNEENNKNITIRQHGKNYIDIINIKDLIKKLNHKYINHLMFNN